MNVEKFECEDRYEAEKLAGFLSVHQDKSTFLHGIAAIVQSEVVIILKDKSSHSVIMKDHNTAVRLKSFIEDIIVQKKIISESSSDGYVTEITLR